MASTEAGAGRPCVKKREGLSGMTEAPAPRSLPLVFPAGGLFPRGSSQSALCGGGGGMLREADCSLASAGNSGHKIWPDRPEESCPLWFLVAPEGLPGCPWGLEEAEQCASLSDHVSDAWPWCRGSVLARTQSGQHPGCVLTSITSPAALGLLHIIHSLPTPTARAQA